MNREIVKELLPIIQAFADGKRIEYSNDGEEWSETETPTWDTDLVYRIKPEPKFDPKTLQPFDRVLARDADDRVWFAQLFSHINTTGKVIVEGCTWEQVIPYNDDTKLLIGTTEEAPEYYRYWED